MVDRASSPHTVRDWMQRTDRRLSLLERHKHPTAAAAAAPPPSGGGLLGIRTARGASQVQTDITTGNGSGNPYQQMQFQTYTFADIDGGTHGLVPSLPLVTAPTGFGFDVAAEGMYQVTIEVGYTFDTPPEAVHWRFDSYDDYYEFKSEPHPGFGVCWGPNGGTDTFTTPVFYEPPWDAADGRYYLRLVAQWRTLGHTMGSQFGSGTPTVLITVVRWV